MDLKARLKSDLTDAMRARDATVTATLRMILTSVTKAEVGGKVQTSLSDDQVIEVLQAEAKRRSDAAELYDAGNRPELAAKERAEADVIVRYLPAAMTDEELGVVVAEEVALANQAGATGPNAMGAVIKAVRARTGATATGGRVAAAVKTALS